MTPAEIRALVEVAANDAMARFPGWSGTVKKVTFFAKGATAGRAWGDGTLEFNTILAQRAGAEFKRTVYHEVAHLVVREVFPYAKQAHGPEFKFVMRSLGHDPSTYHKYDVSGLKRTYNKNPTKYIYVCNCGEHEVSPILHSRMSRGQLRTCNRCRGVLRYANRTKVG
jgi:predicted SprT family Zn-dependent metalloprotease